MITLVHVSDYDPYTKHISYKGDSIIGYIDAGVNSSSDTLILNSFGLTSTYLQVVPSNNGVYRIVYNYDAKGQLESSWNSILGSPVTIYTFINGDAVYIKNNSQASISIDTMTYYTDKPLVPVDFPQYNQYLFYSAYYYKNKHLVKSYQSGQYHGNYTYDFDANGNVATLYSDFGIGKDTLHFTYICP